AAEDDAADAFVEADAQRLARRLSGRGRRVDRALAGNHEVCFANTVPETQSREDLPSAGYELGAERGKGRAEAARGAGSRQPGVGRELAHRGEPALQQLDLLRRRAFLRRKPQGRVSKRHERVAEDGR